MTHHWGYIGAMTAAVFFGISTTLNKMILSDIHPILVAGFIYFIAGILLFAVRFSPLNKKIIRLLKTEKETEQTIVKKDYVILLFVILCGSLLAPFLFMNGLHETTAVNASLLLNTESLFTVGIAFIFLKERGTKKEYIGVILIILGAIVVTTSGQLQNVQLTEGVFGSMLVVGACIFWGIDNNLSKFLSKKQDLILMAALKCFIGGFLLLVAAMIVQIPFSMPLQTLPYLITVGALGIGFSLLFFMFALREIGVMKTGVIFSTSSLIGAVCAFIILRESFTFIQIIAGIIMLFGVYLLYYKGKQKIDL
jgi:drug/metabolite transporter (DMT)-like permease